MTGTAANAYVPNVANQPLATTLLSLTVIALTATLLTRAELPNEIVVSLAGGSGALVPAITIRLTEWRKPKAARIDELTSGEFHRSAVQVTVIAAALIVFLEYGMQFVAGFSGGLMLAALSEYAGSGLSQAVDEYVESVEFAGAANLVAAAWTVVFMVPLGKFMSHRIEAYRSLWIVIAIAAAQGIQFFIELAFFRSDLSSVWLPYLVYVPLLAVPAWFGHLWARRTHPLFLMRRLYRQLSPDDRQAVMTLMRDASREASAEPAPAS